MTVATVTILDPTNPVELQDWLNNNPNVSIFDIIGNSTIFYILYN